MTATFSNTPQPASTLPPALAQTSPLSESDAVRFLQRATFGPEQADITRLRNIGIDAWFDEQFARTRTGSMYSRTQRTDYIAPAMWQQYLLGADQLRKRVAYALSQIFVVSTFGVSGDAVAWYADRLEDGAFGTYRELIETITRSMAMGEYLTFLWSSKANPDTGSMPDENYAREILQLFSIGLDELNNDGTPKRDGSGNTIPTYDQDDIINLARVFTGWIPNLRDGEPYSASYNRQLATYPRIHSEQRKRFLDADIPAGTDQNQSLELALDAIDRHPNVGPFIGRQLIQRLVTSNPSPNYVRRIANVWANDGSGVRGNLRAVVKAILTDPEAWAPPTTTSGKLREPVLRFTAIMRMLGIRSRVQDWELWSLSDPSNALGQAPFHAPSVFNFYRPGYVPPQTPLGNRGLVAPEFQIANEATVIAWLNFVSWFIRYPLDTVRFSAMGDFKALADDPTALVDRIAALLCGGSLRNDIRRIAIDRVTAISLWNNTDETRTERVCAAIVMIAASPDFLVEQ